MRLKIAKNSPVWLGALLAAMVVWLALAAQPAHAADPFRGNYRFQTPDVQDPANRMVCAIDNRQSGDANRRSFGLTKRIVLCVKETVLSAVEDSFLLRFSQYMATTVAACITLAVALWATMLITGHTRAPFTDALVLAVKIGAVLIFTWNFGGLFPAMLDAMEYMLGVVTSYVIYSPTFNCQVISNYPSMIVWDRIDCILESLFGGIFSTNSMVGGIVGFLVLCLFSGSMGIFIALLGGLMLFKLLHVLAQALYIFISSYIAFALMVLISPLFIPLILFRATKGYFEKWLKLTMGFILQPIFLFAYLAMMLAAFDVTVYSGPNSLYRAIAGRDASAPDFKIGQWLNDKGVYVSDDLGQTALKVDWRDAANKLGAPGSLDTGVLSNVGQYAVNQAGWRGTDGVMSFLGSESFFKVSVPTRNIDWGMMMCANSDLNQCPANYDDYMRKVIDYAIHLFLSFIMALVVMYVFATLLEYLPFIGSGMSGESLSMPTFGANKLAPPGGGMISGIKEKLAAQIGGGK